MTRAILFRHLLRQVALATLAVGVVLLVVLLTYQFAFVLGRAADGQVPASVVPALLGLSLRGNLNIILPFAVLLGTVVGLGRLYHESEIAAAQACGAGNGLLFGAAGAVTALAAALAAWMAFVDAPVAAREVVALRTAALRTAVTRGLVPGEFRSLGQGTTLHFRARGADSGLRGVFLQRDLPAGADGAARMQLVLADTARYVLSADESHYLIDLTDGHSYEGVPGRGDWRVVAFRQQFVRIPVPQASLPGRPRVDVLGTRELVGATDPRRLAELHWRLAWVLNVIVLGLLAVPLARLQPRQGRHARVPWAVLLFAVYAGMLTAGRNLVERGDVPMWLGLWWVHLAALVLGLSMLRLPPLVARIWWRMRGAA